MTEKKDGYIPPQEKEPAQKEWWEVARTKEVGFVGDLNGSIKAFLKNLLDLGYITLKKKENGQEVTKEEIEKINEISDYEINNLLSSHKMEWTGTDKPQVLLGDILGDRAGNGDRVFHLIMALEKKGADITVLVGNHDVGAFLALVGGRPNDNRLHLIPDQAPLTEYQHYEDWATGTYNQEEMYKNPDMVEHIQQIKKMKVGAVIDDTFFAHADVDPDQFIALYKKYNPDDTLSFRETIEKMNATFKEALDEGFPEIPGAFGDTIIDHTNPMTRKFRLNELCKPGEILSVLCGWPANRFIKRQGTDPVSGARIVETHEYPDYFFEFLKKRGINAFVFGHNDAFTTFTKNNTLIIPADGLSEKTQEPGDYSYSNGKIHTNGHIDISVGKRHEQNVRSR